MIRHLSLCLALAAGLALVHASPSAACDGMKNAADTTTASTSSDDASARAQASASECQGGECTQSRSDAAEQTVAATD